MTLISVFNKWISKYWVNDNNIIYSRWRYIIYYGGTPKVYRVKKERDLQWKKEIKKTNYKIANGNFRNRYNYSEHIWRIDIDRKGKIYHYEGEVRS